LVGEAPTECETGGRTAVRRERECGRIPRVKRVLTSIVFLLLGLFAQPVSAGGIGWQVATQTVNGEERGFSYGYGGEVLSETIPGFGSRTYVNSSADHVLWSEDRTAGVPAGNGTVNFWLADLNGSVYGLTSASGSMLERQRYDSAYGKGVFTDPAGSPLFQSTRGNRLGFQGRTNLPEFGLQNFRNRFYDPSIGRFLSRDPLGLIDGPAVYAFCGGDPANRSDPMGTWWYWGGSSWKWIGSDPRPPTTPPIPSNWGHHSVATRQVEIRAEHLSEEAQMYFKGGEGMFSNWPAGAQGAKRHGRQTMKEVSAFMYENLVGAELDAALEVHKTKGTKMTMEEAQRFGEYIKGNLTLEGRVLPTEIASYNQGVAELRAEAEAAVLKREAEEAAAARRPKGKRMGAGEKALIGLAALGAAEAVDRKVQAGESPVAAVAGTVKDVGVAVVTQPVHDVRTITRAAGEAVQAYNDIVRAASSASVLDRQAEAQAFNRMSVDPSNAPIGIPRSPSTFGLGADLIRGTGQSTVQSASGFAKDAVQPVQYWWNRLFGGW